MVSVVLNGIGTVALLWMSVASWMAGQRAADRPLLLLAVSIGAIGIGTTLPLVNAIVGGFGPYIVVGLVVWFGLLVLGGLGITLFTTTFGGLNRLRKRGISLWDILLLRSR